jgi:3-deoxy-D-manno-octulosonate 8-phosphate phosphatase (KDO 8-P phosphatase)
MFSHHQISKSANHQIHKMNVLEKFKTIKTFVFDVDGVLTEGSLLILHDGQMARLMNIKDGYALQLAVKKGYRVVIISGGTSDAVKDRLEKLGVKDCFLKVDDKKEKLNEYVSDNQLNRDEILFMGDDIPDYVPMQLTGLPCCPADAVAEIKGISLYISPVAGGKGCVRDVIEKVLKLNGHWELDTTVASR